MNMQRDPDLFVRTKNESRLAIAILAIAMGSVGVLPIFNAAAARTIGSSGLGFSCDVNTKQCSCTGTYDGADCTAMKANCDSKCDNDDGSKCYKIECNATGCSCKMARTEPPASAGGAPIRTGAGLCLDVHAPDANKNGGRVQVWACNGQPQQRWTYDRTARAVRAASGLCLDVHAPELTTNGGRVQVWACNGQQQQQWASLANGSLQNAGGLCLDVHAPDQANDGGRVQVWQCNSSQQQRFTSSVFKSKASSPVAVDGLHSLAQVSALQAEKADTKASAPEDDAVVGGNAIVAGSQVEVALGTSSSTENDTDRPGADFSNFTLSPGSASACRGYCIKDSRCKAWTYVRPRIQGPSAVCYLKNAMPPATPNNCCVSGVVPRGPVGVSPNLPPPASQN